jgi:hypothetical protein
MWGPSLLAVFIESTGHRKARANSNTITAFGLLVMLLLMLMLLLQKRVDPIAGPDEILTEYPDRFYFIFKIY